MRAGSSLELVSVSDHGQLSTGDLNGLVVEYRLSNHKTDEVAN